MTIEAKAWKNLVNEQHIYNMQFVSGSAKDTKNIQETLKGWKTTALGIKKDGSEVMVFSKPFKDTLSWIEWAKTAPFIINEEDKDGESKRLKTTVVLPDDDKRKCGKCGKSGHNARTCGKVDNQPVKVKGKKICGHCGGVGHNKRTCMSYKRNLEDFKDSQ